MGISTRVVITGNGFDDAITANAIAESFSHNSALFSPITHNSAGALISHNRVAVIVMVPASSTIPSNALLAEDGTPILTEDGNFILTEEN